MRQRHKHGDEQIRAIWMQANGFKDSYDDMNFTPPYLSTITARTLIVHGDRDPLYPVNLAVEMHSAIPLLSLDSSPRRAGHGPIFAEHVEAARPPSDSPRSRWRSFATNEKHSNMFRVKGKGAPSQFIKVNELKRARGSGDPSTLRLGDPGPISSPYKRRRQLRAEDGALFCLAPHIASAKVVVFLMVPRPPRSTQPSFRGGLRRVTYSMGSK